MNKNEREADHEIISNLKLIQEDSKNHPFRDISIILDSYDDIFSDFDPRIFSERNISDDFLYELKKVCKENKSPINSLKLLVPDEYRNAEYENLIIKRLHTHLKKNYHDFLEVIKIQKRNGWMFVISGIILMMVASYISLLNSKNFMMHTLLVILEPAGWFILWTGLDDLKRSGRSQLSELDLYVKMAKSKIIFSNS